LLRDYGFNGIVQEYPFFMPIFYLFKENGPENSLILYNGPSAISKQRQTLPFDCTHKKPNGKWTQINGLQPQHFGRLFNQHASKHKAAMLCLS
jgi:hypothetical protein